ncbi:MAG: hypothetical protein ACJAZO_002014 [Myxococcota bacterium]|jgi:hypothetical protein
MSRFLLDRYHIGELSDEQARAVEAALRSDPAARQHLAELDAAKSQVPVLDLERLRPKTVVRETPTIPEPANRPKWHLFLPLILAALILLAMVPALVAPTDPGTVANDYVGVRGDRSLLVYQLIGDSLRDYDGRPLAAGESIGLGVHPDGAMGVVVVSVDGEGQASVLYPESGMDPEPLVGDGRTVSLPGTLILDDAPGPETLIAVFDRDVDEVLSEAADRYDARGIDGLTDWADDDTNVDVAIVERLTVLTPQ